MQEKIEIINGIKEYIRKNHKKDKWPVYFRINDKGQYLGWVSKISVNFDRKNLEVKCFLNLTDEKDLFILFALAGAWSHSGQWENGAYFALYLKNSDWKILDWESHEFSLKQQMKSNGWLNNVSSRVDGKERSFRPEFCDTTHRLAKEWKGIKAALKFSEQLSEWRCFSCYLKNLKIIDNGKRSMDVKIPFILRELRCQGIYKDIPGKLCCVADARVREFYEKLVENTGKKEYKLAKDSMLASNQIYQDWGDLYDLPPFSFALDENNKFTLRG